MNRMLALLVVALACAACRAPQHQEAPKPAPQASADRSQPPADGWFRYRMREDPPELDPVKCTDTQSAAVVLRVFDGLVEFDPMTLQVRPAVAKSWTISPDGLVYEFALREDVKFHGGRLVTAEDVVYSWNRVFAKEVNSERRWVLEPVKGAKDVIDGEASTLAGLEILSPHSLRVTLERPYGPFLGQICMEAASIVPKEVYDDPAKAYTRKPVGCGPFEFVEWQQGNYLKVKAFDGYYKGRPALNGIHFRFIADMSTAVEEYKNGGLEMVDELPPGQLPHLKSELPGQVHVWPQLGSYGYAFNHQLPPFKGNLKLRQAFQHAVNRTYICERIQEGKDTPSAGWVPPGLPGHRAAADRDLYDPELAKKLLAEAGYPEGKGLAPITFWTNTREDHLRIAQRVQADLAAIGVTIELQNLDWASYLQYVQATPEQNTEAAFFRQGWVADYPDADNFLSINLARKNWGPSGNYSRYDNPAFDALLERAIVSSDPAERARLYEEADQMAHDDAALLFIYFYGDVMLLKPYVKGFALSPQGDFTSPMEEVSFRADGG